MVRIGIIGGGPGGLFTAHCLLHQEPDLDITIFEATPDLGGKIRTAQFATAPVTYEAGVAELYHPKKVSDSLLTLLKEYGFHFIKMGGDVSIYKGRIVQDIDALKEVVGESCWSAITSFIELGKKHRAPEDFSGAGWPKDNKHPWFDLTLQEVLKKHVPNADARLFFEKIIKSDLATEPSVANGTYGFDNYLVDDPDYCQIYTIDGGISGLIEALTKELSDRVTFLVSSPVRSIKPLEASYRVTYKNEERILSDEFDAIMVCLPLQWLPGVDFSEPLTTPMAEHFAHYYYPGHYLRVACLFSSSFWSGVIQGSYFRLDAFGGCCVYDETSRYPFENYGALNWLIAGSNAEALSNLDDDLLIQKALESLPPELARKAKSEFLEGRVHRWVGSVNGQPGGRPVLDIQEKHVVDKTHPTFVVVGDYLFDSTLNGLLDSAELATKMLLETLQQTQSALRNPGKIYSLSPRLKKLMRH